MHFSLSLLMTAGCLLAVGHTASPAIDAAREPATNLAAYRVDTSPTAKAPARALTAPAGRPALLKTGPVKGFAETQQPSSVLPVVASPIVRQTEAEIAVEAQQLLIKAKASPTGIAGVTFQRYAGHNQQLTVRVKSGGAEEHAYWNDIFIVLDGEATELTGGTIIGAKTDSVTGETRGSRVEGGSATPMRKGDVIHIQPNTPHQTIVEPGHSFTYYVIKVVAPGAPVQ